MNHVTFRIQFILHVYIPVVSGDRVGGELLGFSSEGAAVILDETVVELSGDEVGSGVPVAIRLVW